MSNPEDLLEFVESREFTAAWEDLGLDDAALAALQLTIMTGGKNAPVIKGTGGLRKLRFSPPAWNVGKRGALRVCFVHFAEYGFVYLMLVYAKTEADNLSESGKRALRQMIDEARHQLDRLFGGQEGE